MILIDINLHCIHASLMNSPTAASKGRCSISDGQLIR